MGLEPGHHRHVHHEVGRGADQRGRQGHHQVEHETEQAQDGRVRAQGRDGLVEIQGGHGSQVRGRHRRRVGRHRWAEVEISGGHDGLLQRVQVAVPGQVGHAVHQGTDLPTTHELARRKGKHRRQDAGRHPDLAVQFADVLEYGPGIEAVDSGAGVILVAVAGNPGGGWVEQGLPARQGQAAEVRRHRHRRVAGESHLEAQRRRCQGPRPHRPVREERQQWVGAPLVCLQLGRDKHRQPDAGRAGATIRESCPDYGFGAHGSSVGLGPASQLVNASQ